jgi:multicomponent Na+:H+ antiporter subunit D
MDTALTLPILIPLTAAIICVLSWHRPEIQRIVTVVAMAALLAAGVALLQATMRDGFVVGQIGSWPAPYGITLVADLLSAVMVVVAGLIGLAVAIYSLGSIDAPREAHGYHVLVNVLLMGVTGSFLTGDMFNMFVWFEVMLIASFVLMALGGERTQLDGATKYVTLNLVSSTLFLTALGILYGLAGTLNMADLAERLGEIDRPALVATVAVMFIVTFGIKAAMFPLFFWLPASYHTPPVAVSALFAGLLTKVGVYALIRTFTLLFVDDAGFTHTLLLVLSGLTMLTGVLGALAQVEVRRILSFHIVSQIGYMTMGLGLFSRLALAGSVFYVVHHIVVKTNLFFIDGVGERLRGSSELRRLRGLYRERPALAVLFMVAALSLAGMPPLSGFWAKLVLVKAGLELEHYAIVGVALLVGLFTLMSMTKVWREAYWKSPRKQTDAVEPASRLQLWAMLGPVGGLAAVTLTIGFVTAPFFDLALRAADQLLDRGAYVRAVLETR